MGSGRAALLLLIAAPAVAGPGPDCPALEAEARAWAGTSPLEDGLSLANRLEPCAPEVRGSLEDALRAAARAEAHALRGAGRFPEARFLLARLSGRLDLAEDLRALERAWAAEAFAAAARDEAAGRLASALVRASLAAHMAPTPEALADRDRLRAAFLARGTIAVSVAIEGPAEARREFERALFHALPAIVHLDDSAPDLRWNLALEVPDCTESRVESSASLPVTEEVQAERERRIMAEARVAEARLALESAAASDRGLRRALAHRGDVAPDRRTRRALDSEPFQALAAAEAALAALPPPPPARAFRFPVTTWTLTCGARAYRIPPNPTPGARFISPLWGHSASTSDATHPAFPDQGVDEDPLRYPKTEAELRARALESLAGQVAKTLLSEVEESGLAAAPTGPPPADPAALEAATRRVLLALLRDRNHDRAAAGAWLQAAFGLDDLDALPKP